MGDALSAKPFCAPLLWMPPQAANDSRIQSASGPGGAPVQGFTVDDMDL